MLVAGIILHGDLTNPSTCSHLSTVHKESRDVAVISFREGAVRFKPALSVSLFSCLLLPFFVSPN